MYCRVYGTNKKIGFSFYGLGFWVWGLRFWGLGVLGLRLWDLGKEYGNIFYWDYIGVSRDYGSTLYTD